MPVNWVWVSNLKLNGNRRLSMCGSATKLEFYVSAKYFDEG